MSSATPLQSASDPRWILAVRALAVPALLGCYASGYYLAAAGITVVAAGVGPIREAMDERMEFAPLPWALDAALIFSAFVSLWVSGRLDGWLVLIVGLRYGVQIAASFRGAPLSTLASPAERMARTLAALIAAGGFLDIAVRTRMSLAIGPAPIFSVATLLLAVLEIRLLIAGVRRGFSSDARR